MLTNDIIIKANVIQNDVCDKQKVVSFSIFLQIVVELAVMFLLSMSWPFQRLLLLL